MLNELKQCWKYDDVICYFVYAPVIWMEANTIMVFDG